MAAAKTDRPRARLVALMQGAHLPYPASEAEAGEGAEAAAAAETAEGGTAGAAGAAEGQTGQAGQRRLRIQFQRSPTAFQGDAEGHLSGVTVDATSLEGEPWLGLGLGSLALTLTLTLTVTLTLTRRALTRAEGGGSARVDATPQRAARTACGGLPLTLTLTLILTLILTLTLTQTRIRWGIARRRWRALRSTRRAVSSPTRAAGWREVLPGAVQVAARRAVWAAARGCIRACTSRVGSSAALLA